MEDEDQPDDTQEAERKPAKFWHNQIEAADEREKKWRQVADEIVSRYLDERDKYETASGCERRINIFWSNTEVLKANLFAQLGQPDVRRAFPQPGEKNKIARTAALVIERNLVACNNLYDPEIEIEDGITDMLTAGRGQCWLDYDPTIGTDEDGKEKITYQEAKFCHVPWDDFRHGAAKKWSDVPWVARKLLYTKSDVTEMWPQWNRPNSDPEAKAETQVPCNYTLVEGKDRDADQGGDDFKRAVIYEIWHKKSKKRIYVAKDFQWVLEEQDDPYKLRNFFPCPKPLYSVKSPSRLVPRPEYLQYKDQAEELDRVNTRVWKLLESLKYRGFRYAGLDSEDTLGSLGDLDDGEFRALKNYQTLAQGGGLKSAFDVMDLQPIVIAIQAAAERGVQLIQSIYEITGISDVVRGSSDPNETATAQSLKARFGSQRLQKRQKEVQRFVKELYQLKGELIAEHFQREQLASASGILLPTEAERQQARQMLAMVEQMKAAQQQQPSPQGPQNMGEQEMAA